MKFLADMGVSPVTVAFLRKHGHEAVRLPEVGLEGRAWDEMPALTSNVAKAIHGSAPATRIVMPKLFRWPRTSAART